MMRLIGIDASSSGLASHSAGSSSGSVEPAFSPWAKELAVGLPNQRPMAAAAVTMIWSATLIDRNEDRTRSGVRSAICVLPDIFGAMKALVARASNLARGPHLGHRTLRFAPALDGHFALSLHAKGRSRIGGCHDRRARPFQATIGADGRPDDDGRARRGPWWPDPNGKC